MAENAKHGAYITELCNVTSMYKQITSPQILSTGGNDFNGAAFSLGLSYLTEPFVMVEEAHTHDFDQVVYFLGGDPSNIGDFGAVVEMSVGDPLEKHTITYTSCVYIPAGVLHCPLNIKSVTKPIIFIDITLSPGASIRPLPDSSRRD